MHTPRPCSQPRFLLCAGLALLALLAACCTQGAGRTATLEPVVVAATGSPQPTASPLPTEEPPPATPTVPPPTDTPAPPTESPTPAAPTETPTPAPPTETLEPTAIDEPTRVPYRPPNGQVPAAPADAQAPADVRETTVRVKNGTDSDALVILVNLRTGGKRAAYIWAGSSAEMNLGGCQDTYEIYFSKGEDWDEGQHAFTRDVVYQKFEDTLGCAEDGQAVSYELTLYAVEGGNAATEMVDPDEFPGL